MADAISPRYAHRCLHEERNLTSGLRWIFGPSRLARWPCPLRLRVRLPKVKDQTPHGHSDNHSKPRRAWVAGIANFAPPLGHFYVGRPLRGLVIALAVTIISIGALLISLRPLGLITVVLMVLILLIGYVVPIADAAILARRIGNEYTPQWYNRWYMYVFVLGIVALLGGVVKSVVRAHLV